MKKYIRVYDDQFGCTFVSLYVLIWRAHYIHIMMGFLYDVSFCIALTYLMYVTITRHIQGITAIGIYKVLFRNHDSSKIRITHYVIFCNVTAVFNNTLNLRVRISDIQSYIPM